MKALFFSIAEKIASDKSEHTLMICASILMDPFKQEGYSEKASNSMAIDGMRVIVKTMQRVAA